MWLDDPFKAVIAGTALMGVVAVALVVGILGLGMVV